MAKVQGITALVLDTHALLWYWNDPQQLSPAAASAIDEAVRAGHRLFVSSVSVVETIYLTEKGRIDPTQLRNLLAALRRSDADVVVKPFDLDIAEALQQIPRDAVPDMPDRMIAATALHLKLPLVTTDAQVRAAGIDTIW